MRIPRCAHTRDPYLCTGQFTIVSSRSRSGNRDRGTRNWGSSNYSHWGFNPAELKGLCEGNTPVALRFVGQSPLRLTFVTWARNWELAGKSKCDVILVEKAENQCRLFLMPNTSAKTILSAVCVARLDNKQARMQIRNYDAYFAWKLFLTSDLLHLIFSFNLCFVPSVVSVPGNLSLKDLIMTFMQDR